jgi:hypothetical protein
MSDEVTQESGGGMFRWVVLAVGAIFAIGASYFIYDGRARTEKLESEATAAKAQAAEMGKRLAASESNSEALAAQLGMTKKELQQKSAALIAQQRSAEAAIKEQTAELGKVSGEVAGVKTDVGGVKTDVAGTKADLEATKAKLERAVGDLGVQSGLIAKTAGDLDILKHRGDRKYYEFSLSRGKTPTPVSTVSLQLKKTDAKRSKFTLNVMSDDRTIEKKDRNALEPIQFYSGRDRLLYELVVWTVDKDKITGYLSTPQAAPTPVTAAPQ